MTKRRIRNTVLLAHFLIYLMISLAGYALAALGIKLFLHRSVNLSTLLFWTVLAAVFGILVERIRRR